MVDMEALRVLAEIQGFFTRAQARELGYDDRAVTRAVRAKLWLRIRRGYYVFTEVWSGLDDVGRHLVRSHAVLHSLGDDVALSHVSGVLQHGIATWNMDLSRVNVTRLDGGPGRIERDVVHHVGSCVDGDVVEIDGHRVIAADRCVLEAGSRVGGERALIMLNSGLHLAKYSTQQLDERFAKMAHWPYLRSMHIPVRLADARVESVGESRGGFFFWTHHLPAPQPQFEVYDEAGELVGTTDWGWPEHGLLGEFDGRIKYGRLLKPGQTPGDVVFAEKQREERLREVSGLEMIRIVWDDYARPRLLEARLRKKLGLRPRATG